jgi:hypothetical protein
MTDLDIYQPNGAALAVPDPFDTDSWITVVQDIIKIANVIFDTPFVPDGLRGSAPAVAAAMLAGREMGLGIMTSLANIDVIKGKPTQKALLMRAMIQSKGHKWEDVDVSPVRVVVRGCRKGESSWGEGSFTAAEAKLAGIDLGKYPVDKLYARATSRLARRKFADVIMGMPYSSEELEDGNPDDVMLAGDPGYRADRQAAKDATQPAPRTAHRRGRAPQNVPPADSATPPAPAAASPAQAAPAGGTPLPPLPGEDEPGPAPSGHPAAHEAAAGPDSDDVDRDQQGTATRGKGGQLTAIWTVLSTVFGFGDDEKEQARRVCEHIIGRKLIGGTTGNLSYSEAHTVLDTLANWENVAQSRGDAARDVLISVMAEGEVPSE